MGTYKSAAALTMISFKRWRHDTRIWFIFAFIAMIVGKELGVFTRYGLEQGGDCTIFVLPILFSVPGNALGSMKMLIHVGLLLLLCDAPFLHQMSPYMILRARRRAWWMSSCLYIMGTAFVYILFLTLLSMLAVLPVASVSREWGSVLQDMVFGGTRLSLQEINDVYHHIRISDKEINFLYADSSWLYTIAAVWADFTCLGLLMHLISLFKRNILWAISGAAFFVFLDPLLTWLDPWLERWYWLVSPVSWSSADATNAVNRDYIITIPFVAAAYSLLLILLIAGIALRSRKVSVELL